jgi:hypothetical protein
MTLERKGIPTATVVTHAFAAYAKGLCKMQGMEATPLIVILHPVASRPESELHDKVKSAYALIRKALLKDAIE